VERHVTLSRITPKDRESTQTSGEYSSQLMQIVESFGGTIEGLWSLGDGPYRFVWVATYPDEISASKARTQIEAIGVITIEGYPVFEMPECLQAMAA
jgi:uncharacterized protein with GYD domain